MLASVSKDNVVKIWRHTSDIAEEDLDATARIYQSVSNCKPQKHPIRCVLWKKYWVDSTPIRYSIFSSSEVKMVRFRKEKLVSATLKRMSSLKVS